MSDLIAGALALALPLLLGLLWWTLQTPSRWVLLFLAAALCLPPLPVPLGDTGPHPALLFAAAGLLAGMIGLPRWGGPLPPSTLWLPVYLLLLLGSVSLAALYSGADLALASLARVALFGISIYVFFYIAAGPGVEQEPFRGIRWLYGAAVAAALFACIDFYYQLPAPAGYGPQFVWMESGVYRRAQGFFYEASTLGNMCVFFLVMAAVSLLRPARETPVSRPMLWAGSAVIFTALMLSYSRASVINLIAAIFTLLFLHRSKLRFGRLLAILSVVLGAGLAAAYAFVPEFLRFYWIRVEATLSFLITDNERLLAGRLESWRALFAFLEQNPWHGLLGVGYKTLPYSDFIGQPVVADNAYLSALVETGLVGLAALLMLNLAVLYMGLRAARSPDWRASFFGTWIACFWVGQMLQMMSGDLFTYWRVLPLYFWALAMAVRLSRPAVE